MSGSIAEKYGGQTIQDDLDMIPSWVSNPDNIPFSKNRQTSEYETYYRLQQESIAEILKSLDDDPTISPRFKKTIKIIYIPQKYHDSLMSAIYPHQAARIIYRKKLELLKLKGSLYPSEAAKPVITAAIMACDESLDYMLSKVQRDMYNERQNIKDEKILNRTEYTASQTLKHGEEQKRGGILGFFRGGNK